MNQLPVAIHGLALTNFRNATSSHYTFGEGLIFITGNNGAGKTTILEAIGLGSFLKSFRAATDQEMIRFGSTFYRVEVEFALGGAKRRVAIAFGRNTADANLPLIKKYTLDGRPDTKAADIIGKIPTVVLSPDDMRIIAGEYSERRRFLDLLLSMLYPSYFTALQQYQRALKLRSQALRNKPDEAVLSAIDRELAQAGFAILEKRREFIPEFREPFNANVAQISSQQDAWQMEYHGETLPVSSVDDYMAMLRERRANDLRLKQTTAGIHRDRLFFALPGNERDSAVDLRSVGSQGQKRTAALALKMAQFSYMQAKLGMRPVLLIDDVLNELDLNRRSSFIDFLGSVGQVFFTTTDLVGMQEFLKDLRKSVPVQTIGL